MQCHMHMTVPTSRAHVKNHFDLCTRERSRDAKMTFLVRWCVHVHVEMTSSFVQYDVGNLFNSYLGTLLGPISIICFVEVSTELSHHCTTCCMGSGIN